MGKKQLAAGAAFLVLCLLFPFFCSYGAQHIVLYHVGEKDQAAATLLKRHLAQKGFGVSSYDGTDDIEKQVELAGKINRIRGALFIAVDFRFSDEEDVTVAISDAKKKPGRFQAIGDVAGMHVAASREAAELIAGEFDVKVLELPLFPLLGIDMPGLFLQVECPKEEAEEVLGKVSGSLQKYFGRGTKK